MKPIFIAVVIAAACSGVAMAGELTQGQKTDAPVMKAKVMSDSEMDKVTAGGAAGLRRFQEDYSDCSSCRCYLGRGFREKLKGSVMTDSEMKKVTAGSVSPIPTFGLDTANTVANSHALNNADPAAQYHHR